jgi:2-keto-3-deoxy-6-phosphogluconate aldolase
LQQQQQQQQQQCLILFCEFILGVLAMPACFSPQELHEAHNQGALCMKLFPAQLWNPGALRGTLYSR